MASPSRSVISSQRSVPGLIIIAVFTFVGVVLELAALQDVSQTDPLWARGVALSFPPLLAVAAVVGVMRRRPSKSDRPSQRRLRIWNAGVMLLLAPGLILHLLRIWSDFRLPNVAFPPWVETAMPFAMCTSLILGGIFLAVWFASALPE